MKQLLSDMESSNLFSTAQKPFSGHDNIIYFAEEAIYSLLWTIFLIELVRFLKSKDKSISYFKKKYIEYKALSIPLVTVAIVIYFLFELNEDMDDKRLYRLRIVNTSGQLRDVLLGAMPMGLIWLYREYRWVNCTQSENQPEKPPQSPDAKRSNPFVKSQPKIANLENRISEVTAEKRSIIKSMMGMIESMRSMLDESNNLRIPITIPINDLRNEQLILTNMKKLKQNIKKICETTSGLLIVTDNGNPKNIIEENNLLKETNQNLKKDLKTAQKESKALQKELKQKNQKAQSELKELENNLACYNQHNSLLENELKSLKKENRDLSNRIKASTKAFADLKCENQQSFGRITAFGARLASLEGENSELKTKLDKAQSKLKTVRVEQSMASTKSRIDALEHANRTLELENSSLREENECSICCEEVKRESDKKWEAFVPCGHRFCSTCARNICSGQNGHNQRVCPNCRTDIEQILTVYDS